MLRMNTLGLGGTSSWSPLGLQPVLYLEAGSGVALNGATVSQWNDLSGNDHPAIQGTTGLQPTFVSPSINGQPTCDFDGTDDIMDTAAGVFTGTAVTVFLVVSLNSVTGSQAILGNRNGNADGFEVYTSGSDLTANTLNGANGSVGFVAIAISTPTIVEVRIDGAGNNNVWANGVAGSGGTGIMVAPTNSCRIAGPQAGSGVTYINGKYGGVVAFDRALATDEQLQVRQYLSQKYGIPVAS